MPNTDARVSVIIPFLNTERFIQETIESVFAQTFPHWELLLVDDGSTDGSQAIAQRYAAQHPEKVRYLTHPGRQNKGRSASRNLGIQHARGEFIAFLDSDDVWLPNKLAEQLAILDAHPQAGALYGATEYWYSWNGHGIAGGQTDHIVPPGIPGGRLMPPPTLVRPFLSREVTTPCTCSILVRRAAIEKIGLWEESFHGMYDDQVFYTKLCLHWPVYISEQCWDRYRQHPDSCCAQALKDDIKDAARLAYLSWVARYFAAEKVGDAELLTTLRRELVHSRIQNFSSARAAFHQFTQRLKRLPSGVARRILPARVRAGIRAKLGLGKAAHPLGSRRLEPLSRCWGLDRGQPIDRYYIESFLARHASDVRGRVLEIGDASYTRRFGGARVTQSDVLHVSADQPQATIIGDLAQADNIPSDAFDCFILTQTLQLIYDLPAAIRTLHRIMKPGGVLLVTVPGITHVCHDDGEAWHKNWYWSFTAYSMKRLFEQHFAAASISVETFGNVLAASAFLHGLSAGELTKEELEHRDPDYEMLIALRVVKTQ